MRLSARSVVLAVVLVAVVSCRARERLVSPDAGPSAGRQSDGGNSATYGGTGTVVAAGAGGAPNGGTTGVQAEVPMPGGPSWLSDPGAWERVDALPGCESFLARDPTGLWPGLNFRSCGAGCEEASLLPGDMPALAATLGTAERTSEGTLRLALSVRTRSEPNLHILGVYTFGTGKPEVLLATIGSTCAAQFAGRGAPSVMYLFPRPSGSSNPWGFGWVESGDSRPVRWLEPVASSADDIFDFGTSWGRMIGRASIYVADDPTSATVRSIYESAGFLNDPVGVAGLAAWGEWVNGEGRVIAWRAAERPTVLARGAWHPGQLAMSDERFAWIGGTGDRASEGAYDSARVYSCRPTTPLGPCDVETGPELPIYSASTVVVSDRFVALTGCSMTECDTYVADREASALYRIPRPHSDHTDRVIGVSETELFLADWSPQQVGDPYYDGIRRYDLSLIGSSAMPIE